MIPMDIANQRLANQLITTTHFRNVKGAVGFMGAMQAQDYAMAKWAVGKRLPTSTDRSIEHAFAKGEILRTHLLRPTWHLVSADDIYWLLALTAPNIRSAMKSRHKGLGLTEALVRKCNTIIEGALVSEGTLTREQIAHLLEKAHVPTGDNNRLSHILLCAELDGLICSGPPKGAKLTYALLAERVPLKRMIEKEEALATLALRYFTSRGPATLQDFRWWSGLTLRDARRALDLVKCNLISDTVDEESYWFPGSTPRSKGKGAAIHLLPAFDEFLIAYRDRSSVLPSPDHLRVVSSNGIFRPVIVADGKVIGIWRRLTGRTRVFLEAEFFQPPDKKTRGAVEKAAQAFAAFLERKVDVAWKEVA
jgi:hypothetical protein